MRGLSCLAHWIQVIVDIFLVAHAQVEIDIHIDVDRVEIVGVIGFTDGGIWDLIVILHHELEELLWVLLLGLLLIIVSFICF